MKIKIDGNEYDFPTLDSITLDEAILLERQAGITLDELLPGEALPAGAFKGLVMIAIKRARPEVTEREIAQRVGQLKLAELDVQKEEEAPADPPTPAATDSSESTASSGANGNAAGITSPAPSPRPATGQRVSATGPGSVHPISAA